MANIPRRKPQEPTPKPQQGAPESVQDNKWKNNSIIKYIHKIFVEVFAGLFLKKLNLTKNWRFFTLIVGLLILFVFNNLNIHSKRKKIDKLNSELIIAGDRMMDAVEDSYVIEDEQGSKILDSARKEGFESDIPYEIETKRKR